MCEIAARVRNYSLFFISLPLVLQFQMEVLSAPCFCWAASHTWDASNCAYGLGAALAVIPFAHSALNWWWLGAVLLLGASWSGLGSWSGFSLCHNQPLWALLGMVSGLPPVVAVVMWWSLIDLNYYFYIWLPLTYVCCVLPAIVALCSGVNESQNRWGLVGPPALQSLALPLQPRCLFSAQGTQPHHSSCSFMSSLWWRQHWELWLGRKEIASIFLRNRKSLEGKISFLAIPLGQT